MQEVSCLSCRKKDGKEEEGKVRKVREPKKKVQEAGEEDGEWETIQRKQAKVMNKQEIKRMLFGKEVDEIDHAIVKERRDEIVGPRGKKTMDRSTNIDNLKLLIQFSDEAKLGVGIELMLLVDVISIIYEIPSAAACMKDDLWERQVLGHYSFPPHFPFPLVP